MSDIGLPELLDALVCRSKPHYGAPEHAAWEDHRSRVIAALFGVDLDNMPESKRKPWRDLEAHIDGGPVHPLGGFLEAGLIERRFGIALAPVHEAFRRLEAVHRAERLRLLHLVFGGVTPLPSKVVDANLDQSLAPDWDAIFDRI